MLVGIFTIRNWTKNMTKNILLICRLAKLIFLTCQKKKKKLGSLFITRQNSRVYGGNFPIWKEALFCIMLFGKPKILFLEQIML
jgi:hypothetical protein